MSKNTEAIHCFILFSHKFFDVPMAAMSARCDPDQEYIYFMLILIKNIYTLWPDQEYIFFIWSQTSPSLRWKLLTEINTALQTSD